MGNLLNKTKFNIGMVYFLYLLGVLFLQIIGLSGKGGTLDTLWKAAVITITLIYVFLKCNREFSKTILLLALIYVLSQVIALAGNGLQLQSNFLNQFITIIIILAMVYLFIDLPLKNNEFNIESLYFFLNGFIILMLYAVIYNFAVNPNGVINFLSNTSAYSDMLSSFFDNKQTFGMFLFMAVIASTWLYILKRKKRYFFCLIIFFINLFICLSRTALFACLLFIILTIVLTWNKDKRLASMYLVSALILVVIVLIVPQLRHFISNVVLDTDATMDARTNIWEDSFSLLHGKYLIFGYGEGSVSTILSESAYSHNGIIHVLLTGGVVKLLLYFIVVGRTLFAYFRIYKYNKLIAKLFFSALMGVLLFSMGETLVLMDSSAPCVVASIICIAFPISIETYYKRKGKQIE